MMNKNEVVDELKEYLKVVYYKYKKVIDTLERGHTISARGDKTLTLIKNIESDIKKEVSEKYKVRYNNRNTSEVFEFYGFKDSKGGFFGYNFKYKNNYLQQLDIYYKEKRGSKVLIKEITVKGEVTTKTKDRLPSRISDNFTIIDKRVE